MRRLSTSVTGSHLSRRRRGNWRPEVRWVMVVVVVVVLVVLVEVVGVLRVLCPPSFSQAD